jgi:hypothetical protein
VTDEGPCLGSHDGFDLTACDQNDEFAADNAAHVVNENHAHVFAIETSSDDPCANYYMTRIIKRTGLGQVIPLNQDTSTLLAAGISEVAVRLASDCDGNATMDGCEIIADPLLDCDSDGLLDAPCDITGR